MNGKLWKPTPKYIIGADLYKIKDHQYRVAKCWKRKGKIWFSIISKCVNYIRAYVVNFPHCTSRYKAEISTRKEKKPKEI